MRLLLFQVQSSSLIFNFNLQFQSNKTVGMRSDETGCHIRIVVMLVMLVMSVMLVTPEMPGMRDTAFEASKSRGRKRQRHKRLTCPLFSVFS